MAKRLNVDRLQAKLAGDPHSPVFAQLADAYRRGGKLEEAVRLCEEGLSRRRNYAAAYMVLGRAYHEMGDLPEARKAFKRVTHLEPENMLAYGFLGQIAEARGEVPEALDAYRTALILYPFDKGLRAAVARLEARPGGEARPVSPGVAEAHQEPRARAKEPVATETLAELYATQGLYDRAARIYERLMADAPKRADLAAKHREVLTHLAKAPGKESPTAVGSGEALQRLEAWRAAFRRLRPVHRGSTELLEAYQTAFQRLRAKPTGAITVLEAWRDAFRRLRAAGGGGAG